MAEKANAVTPGARDYFPRQRIRLFGVITTDDDEEVAAAVELRDGLEKLRISLLGHQPADRADDDLPRTCADRLANRGAIRLAEASGIEPREVDPVTQKPRPSRDSSAAHELEVLGALDQLGVREASRERLERVHGEPRCPGIVGGRIEPMNGVHDDRYACHAADDPPVETRFWGVRMEDVGAFPTEDAPELVRASRVREHVRRPRGRLERDVAYPRMLEISHPRPWRAQPDDLVTLVAQRLELSKDQEAQAQVNGRQVGDFHRGKRNAGVVGALLRSSGFLAALLTASAVSLLAVVLTRRSVRSLALAITVVAAVTAGLDAEDVLKAAIPAGLVLVGAGALVSEGRPLIVRAASLVPGGVVLVTLGAEGTTGWARALVLLTIVVGGPAAAAVDRRFPSLTIGLLAVSALGAYATVPDTEQARAVVGALLPIAALALLCRSVPEPATPGLGVALVAWVGLIGGVGRPGSVVGAIGCLGVFLLGPLAARNRPAVVVAVHAPIVLIASRVAGLRQSAWTAAFVLLPVLVVAATALTAAKSSPNRNPP
jgi:hypothetical protein